MRMALLSAAAALCVGGCASFSTVSCDVASFGQWPAGRPPADYAFDRLPSQQIQTAVRQDIEGAAGGALARAGFTLAADPDKAAYGVQLGVHVRVDDPWYSADPLWWRGGSPWVGWYAGRFGPRPWGPWFAAGPVWDYGPDGFDREVAVFIRDRASGRVVYEARASSYGPSPQIAGLLPALFQAALQDFPNAQPQPRTIRVAAP